MKLLEIDNLSISIRNDRNLHPKLVDQTLVINEGDVVLLTGPNGCGKSSVIKSLVGDVLDFTAMETKGDFYYFQNNQKVKINCNEKSVSEFAGKTCYISQDDNTSFTTVMDCFLSGIEKEEIADKQKYVFDFILRHKAYQCYFSEDAEVKMTRKPLKLIEKLNLDRNDAANQKTAILLTSKKRNMSGGQAKFLNILSNLVRIEFCIICLIDEPLNNLDYSNVRLFSNIIADLHEEYPKMAFVIVSHCRSIPSINRIVQIDAKSKRFLEVENPKDALHLECNSCFGQIENGRYV